MFIENRRRGNMLLVVTVLIMLTITLTSLFGTIKAQEASAREKARDAGFVNGYVTMANVCGFAFKDDLEAQTMKKVVANVEHPDGIDELGLEIFDEAIAAFQNALTRRGSGPQPDSADKSWHHMLVRPRDAIDFAGVNDPAALKFVDTILKDATVDIRVKSPLNGIGAEDDNPAVGGSFGSVTLADIEFTVDLRKGTWNVTQWYTLRGEKIIARFGEQSIVFTVDGENAECILERQMVTRRGVKPIKNNQGG